MFKFSIVMAVYNVELFLKEAIESVIHQDIGFEKFVQLILVDDGSSDASSKICDSYAAKYAHNILVIHKKNEGVSSARNAGLEMVMGKYVNFLDSDDKLAPDTLRKVDTFFEQHYEETDVVSIPIKFFDSWSGEHILNYKFEKGTRIVNLEKEYTCIQLSAAAAFFKGTEVKNIKFDTRLQYAEDAKLLLGILLKKKSLGLIAGCRYLYRKRTKGEQSAIQKSERNSAWYLDYLRYFTYDVVQSLKQSGMSIPKFVQYALMYDLQWRFEVNPATAKAVLGDEGFHEYVQLLYGALAYIDDDIILKQGEITREYKCFLIAKKYGTTPRAVVQGDKTNIFIGDKLIMPLADSNVVWEFLREEDGNIVLEGYVNFLAWPEGVAPQLYIKVNQKLITCEEILNRHKLTMCLGEEIGHAIAFKAVVPRQQQGSSFTIKILSKIADQLVEHKNFSTERFFPILAGGFNAYAVLDNYIVTFEGAQLNFAPKSSSRIFWREISFLKSLVVANVQASRKSCAARIMYWLLRPWLSKDIWLISDRINKANDNGEAFFKYVSEHRLNRHCYFIIRKDSPDYARIKQYGQVLAFGSLKYKMFHLLAHKIISSGADDYVFWPYWEYGKFFRDILGRQKRVFLQHGIIKDDLSEWLNRFKKNLSLFITSAKPEYESILQGRYYYDGQVVKLTGMPRYDALADKQEKIIMIMPTWRAYLCNNEKYDMTGINEYDASFRESQFFRFYNDLLNNPRLNESAVRYGYKIFFMPHPNLMSVVNWFRKDYKIDFGSQATKYGEMFAKSSLVVTDYSSTAFDFAYLRKPVLYCQFDRSEFFTKHTYTQGYFNYERDGFGEVEYDLEATIDKIIEYMQHDCLLKDKYRQRIEAFFAYNDKNNCQRVYEAIRRL